MASHTKESALRYLAQAKIREGQREALTRQLNTGVDPDRVVRKAQTFEGAVKYQTKKPVIPDTA
jgi:hypothetical protein